MLQRKQQKYERISGKSTNYKVPQYVIFSNLLLFPPFWVLTFSSAPCFQTPPLLHFFFNVRSQYSHPYRRGQFCIFKSVHIYIAYRKTKDSKLNGNKNFPNLNYSQHPHQHYMQNIPFISESQHTLYLKYAEIKVQSVKISTNVVPTCNFLKKHFHPELSRQTPVITNIRVLLLPKGNGGGRTSIIDSFASTPDFVILSPSPRLEHIRTSGLITKFGNMLIKQWRIRIFVQ